MLFANTIYCSEQGFGKSLRQISNKIQIKTCTGTLVHYGCSCLAMRCKAERLLYRKTAERRLPQSVNVVRIYRLWTNNVAGPTELIFFTTLGICVLQLPCVVVWNPGVLISVGLYSQRIRCVLEENSFFLFFCIACIRSSTSPSHAIRLELSQGKINPFLNKKQLDNDDIKWILIVVAEAEKNNPGAWTS